MTEEEWLEYLATLPKCDVCGQAVMGSHYHCARCMSKEVTSMYGHWRSHLGKKKAHFCCEEGCL